MQDILDNEESCQETARVLLGAQDSSVCTYPEVGHYFVHPFNLFLKRLFCRFFYCLRVRSNIIGLTEPRPRYILCS